MGQQIGVLSTPDALQQARNAGLDLVVVSENAVPPVAKIIDFKKFKYQQSKKERAGAAKTKLTSVKEVRLTPFMAQGDFNNRVDRTKEFLQAGHKVKLVVKFVGRQITRKEFGIKQMEDAFTALSKVGVPEGEPKWQGKLYIAQIRPKK